MKIKLDADGHAELKDGNPVYVNGDGAEAAVDVAKLTADVANANGQARDRRLEVERLESEAKLFKGVDPKEAREAIAFRKALGDIDPTKVEHELATLKAANAGLTTQVEERDATIVTADATIDKLSLGAKISGSEFIRTKVVAALQDPALFRAAYGEHLTRDDKGNVIVKDATGNTIMSAENPGQPATLDEALPRVVVNPHHLAAQNANGPGDPPNGGPPSGMPKAGTKLAEMTVDQKAAMVTKAAEQGGTGEEIAARVLANAG